MDRIPDLQQQLTDALEKTAQYRRHTFDEPDLRQLFFELTLRCNLKCAHCGSRCDEGTSGPVTACPCDAGGALVKDIAPQEWKAVLSQVKSDFDCLPQINVTGGEPLLYEGFEEVMSYAHELGFRWGMTTNGTLITPKVARMLKRCHMGSASVSLDALAASHDKLRGVSGAYERTMEGIQNLIDVSSKWHIQVTSVFNHQTIDEMEAMFDLVKDLDVRSYRMVGVEPIGSALKHPELLLNNEEQLRILRFVAEKRREGWPVTYGCSHYLGIGGEGRVRDWLFSCSAGTKVASIAANGDIVSCLNIERNENTVFGNIYNDRFSEVWNDQFETFRRDRSQDDSMCVLCEQRRFCMGGSAHTWDFDAGRQRMCLFHEMEISL